MAVIESDGNAFLRLDVYRALGRINGVDSFQFGHSALSAPFGSNHGR